MNLPECFYTNREIRKVTVYLDITGSGWNALDFCSTNLHLNTDTPFGLPKFQDPWNLQDLQWAEPGTRAEYSSLAMTQKLSTKRKIIIWRKLPNQKCGLGFIFTTCITTAPLYFTAIFNGIFKHMCTHAKTITIKQKQNIPVEIFLCLITLDSFIKNTLGCQGASSEVWYHMDPWTSLDVVLEGSKHRRCPGGPWAWPVTLCIQEVPNSQLQH